VIDLYKSIDDETFILN